MYSILLMLGRALVHFGEVGFSHGSVQEFLIAIIHHILLLRYLLYLYMIPYHLLVEDKILMICSTNIVD
jgi:hypothetical protein